MELDYQKEDTIVISDLHLGWKLSKVDKIREFFNVLIKKPPLRLIIAGDAFEMWSTNFKNIGLEEQGLMRKILELSEKGTKVVYVPGNHDRAFRIFRKITFGKIKIRNEYVIRTHHKKYLVIHGDEFDLFTHNHAVLAILLDQVYVWLVKANSFLKRFFGFRISMADKKNSRRYSEIVERVRLAALAYARSRDLDGIVIGHTHWPEILVEPDGIVYANSGDWTESCTYVVIGQDVKLGHFEKKENPHGDD